jgi:hypothetical protein
VPAKKINSLLFGLEKTMSKQQALLETLLGAAELNGNRTLATSVRDNLVKLAHWHDADGYRRLARAASQPPSPARYSRLKLAA